MGLSLLNFALCLAKANERSEEDLSCQMFLRAGVIHTSWWYAV